MDNPITLLSQFMTQSHLQYRVFDMGRRVTQLTPDIFLSFERCQQPYPYPFQRQAMLGIIFWHETQTEQQWVWFLTFPLDEQGLLDPHSRDAFLKILLERVGASMLAAAEGQKLAGAMQDNPYTFTPADAKMAAFNAKVRATLKQPPSAYFPAAQHYFFGETNLADWQSLALQGIADVAIRAEEGETTLELIAIVPRVPQAVFQSLCSFLEHARPPAGLVEVLSQKLLIELEKPHPDVATVVACLRAASNTPAQGLLDQMVLKTLQNKISHNVEVLAVISGRIWPVLKKAEIAQLFVERLASNDAGQSGFSQLLADILFMPAMRNPIMQALRHPKRSQKLARAVGIMFGQSDKTLH